MSDCNCQMIGEISYDQKIIDEMTKIVNNNFVGILQPQEIVDMIIDYVDSRDSCAICLLQNDNLYTCNQCFSRTVCSKKTCSKSTFITCENYCTSTEDCSQHKCRDMCYCSICYEDLTDYCFRCKCNDIDHMVIVKCDTCRDVFCLICMCKIIQDSDEKGCDSLDCIYCKQLKYVSYDQTDVWCDQCLGNNEHFDNVAMK